MNLKQFIDTNYKDGDFMKRFRAFAKDVESEFFLRYRVKPNVENYVQHSKRFDFDERVRIERLIDVIPYLANKVVSNEWKDDVLNIVLSSNSEFDERDE